MNVNKVKLKDAKNDVQKTISDAEKFVLESKYPVFIAELES